MLYEMKQNSHNPDYTGKNICLHDYTLTRCDKFICSYEENKKESLMESYTPLIQYTAHISSKNTYLNKKIKFW